MWSEASSVSEFSHTEYGTIQNEFDNLKKSEEREAEPQTKHTCEVWHIVNQLWHKRKWTLLFDQIRNIVLKLSMKLGR